MQQEKRQYVNNAGALKRRGSAGLEVITERKPDIAVGCWTHLIGLGIKLYIQVKMQTYKYQPM